MATHVNLARVTTATTGAGGTITLGAAVSGYLTFGGAGVPDGGTVFYGIKDGINSEVGYGIYTASGTTLTRNVITSTNSNNAITLSGAAEVYVTALAQEFPNYSAKGQIAVSTAANTVGVLGVAASDGLALVSDSGEATGLKWAASGAASLTNSSITPTTADVAAAVNYRYFADISGLTADRNFVLPTCSAGDEIELKITTGDDAYELIIKGDTGVTIEGGSAATEWSRLFITGEAVHFIASASNTWRVVYDGRIRCMGLMTLSGNDTTNSAATNTLPTWDNEVIDIGDICDLANKRFNIRRAGYYKVTGCYMPTSNELNGAYISATVFLNGTGGTQISRGWNTAGNATNLFNAVLPARSVLCAVGDYLNFYYKSENANKGALATDTWYQIEEA